MQIIVGVDEVGRGSWAGPVVAGAVILPANHSIAGLRDSKLIGRRERESLAIQIKRQAVAIGLGWVRPDELDENGLSWAVRTSGLRALDGLGQSFDKVILDGKHNYLADQRYDTQVIIKADNLIAQVSAAAIIAKVARDQYMYTMHYLYPDYGFDNHVGYGTTRHKSALAEFGPSKIHRHSYKPVRAAAR